MHVEFPAGHRVMVTGHRRIGRATPTVRKVLTQILQRLVARKPEGIVAISGMAVGADIEFAEVALELGLPLVAAIPLDTQDAAWPADAKARYWRALYRAALVTSVWREPGYEARDLGARFHARNRWMIDHSETVIAVWDGRTSGGTWATVREVLRRNRRVLVVDPATGSLRVQQGIPSRKAYAEHGSPGDGGSVLDMFAHATAEGLDSARYAILAHEVGSRLDATDGEE